MSYLNRIFSVRFTRVMLTIAFFALLIAAIWFLGPFLGFGDTRPLESIESRVIVIVLALGCLLGLWFHIPAFILVVATLCVFVWVITPWVLIGDNYPLESPMARTLVIGLLLIAGLLYGAWKLLLALRANPKFLESFLRTKEARQDVEISEVASVIRNAVVYINKIRKNVSLFQRFFRPRKALNDLPWYMILGTQSSGKTSLILSSGQDFPLPEQLNRVGKETQPTKNADCLFANDALFIDTSGKYVDDAQAWLPEWDALLKAIKKYRPLRAINGIIVTLSASDVMGKNKSEIYDLSSKIRARLDTTRSYLGVRFPVYVAITKMDQLAGFAEYFRILTEQQRQQIWGVTFPYDEEMKTSVADLRELIEEEFSLLEKRIERNMTVRHQEEYDNAERKKMYALPQDFRVLSQGLAEILQNIFFASRYDETQSYTTLRGIYFTSSSQPENTQLVNNGTLIQKWHNFTNNKVPASLAEITTKQAESDFLVKDVAFGRQYFLKQVFSEIVVKDAGLVRHNLKVESKYRFQNFFGHCLWIAVAGILVSGFYHSFNNNGEYLDGVSAKTDRLEKEVKAYLKKTNQTMLPALLNMAQYLPEFGGLNVADPDLEFRYGLYVGHEISDRSAGLYQFFLRRLLFPLIERQAEEALKSAVLNRDRDEIYDRLKLHLMLAGQGKFDQDYLVRVITKNWDAAGKIQPYGERSLFVAHLNNLFGKKDWRRYGDKTYSELVTQARTILDLKPQNARMYERIKELMLPDMPENLTLAKMTDEQAGQVFMLSEEHGGDGSIPGLFTYDGYHQVFKKKLGSLLKEVYDEDSWIMGKPEAPAPGSYRSLKERSNHLINPVKEALTRMYLKEYALQWEEFLEDIRLRSDEMDAEGSVAGLSFDIYMMKQLVSANSPLVNLAKRAVRETTLSEQQASLIGGYTGATGQLLDAASKINLTLAALEKKMLREEVDNYFNALREFVRGNAVPGDKADTGTESASTQLSKVMSALNDQYTQLVISDSAMRDGNEPMLSDVGQKLSAEAHLWPHPFRYILAPLTSGTYRKVNSQLFSNSNETIASSIGEVCQNTLEGRYPFAKGAEEVSIRDFERFFAPGGLADDYFRKHLADKVITSSKPWRYKGDVNEIDSGMLKMFEQAQNIRNTFFPHGAKKLSIGFSLSVPYMDPAITQLNLSIGETSMSYSHGPVTPVSFIWPNGGSDARVNMSIKTVDSPKNTGMTMTGPWALFRWIDKRNNIETSATGKPVFIYSMNNRHVSIEAPGLTHKGRLGINLLREFSCPNDYWTNQNYQDY